LRGAHILPVEAVVGLDSADETIQASTIEEGAELDLVTHDIKKFFSLMLRKNGYVLEQLYSPLIVHSSLEHKELKRIARDCITRHHSHHYLGFAASQWKLFIKEQPPRVKPLLYVYRVLLTGIYLMRTGEIEANLVRLNEHFALPYIPELISRKHSGPEKQALTDVDINGHEEEYNRLCRMLEDAYRDSTLPDLPSARPALNDLLKRLRLGRTQGSI
jgi:predicted nucleotidyltransferase